MTNTTINTQEVMNEWKGKEVDATLRVRVTHTYTLNKPFELGQTPDELIGNLTIDDLREAELSTDYEEVLRSGFVVDEEIKVYLNEDHDYYRLQDDGTIQPD